MKIRVLLAGLFLPLAILAQIPEPVLPVGVGVNIHFITGHERDLDLIAAQPAKALRVTTRWTGVTLVDVQNGSFILDLAEKPAYVTLGKAKLVD